MEPKSLNIGSGSQGKLFSNCGGSCEKIIYLRKKKIQKHIDQRMITSFKLLSAVIELRSGVGEISISDFDKRFR